MGAPQDAALKDRDERAHALQAQGHPEPAKRKGPHKGALEVAGVNNPGHFGRWDVAKFTHGLQVACRL